MMTAKAQGKNPHCPLLRRPRPSVPTGRRRRATCARSRISRCSRVSAASSTASTDVREIGEEIAAELRSLIDFHNCRVFVVDGTELVPVAFLGGLSTHVTSSAPRPSADQSWCGDHGPLRGVRRVDRRRRRRQLRVRASDRRDAGDRRVASRRASPVRISGRRRDRRLEARSRSVRPRTRCGCSRFSPATPPSRSRTRACSRRPGATRESATALLEFGRELARTLVERDDIVAQRHGPLPPRFLDCAPDIVLLRAGRSASARGGDRDTRSSSQPSWRGGSFPVDALRRDSDSVHR